MDRIKAIEMFFRGKSKQSRKKNTKKHEKLKAHKWHRLINKTIGIISSMIAFHECSKGKHSREKKNVENSKFYTAKEKLNLAVVF